MKQARIRIAAVKDAEGLALLARELGYSATPVLLRKRLMTISRRKDHLVLIAEREERLCGWIHAHSFIALESGFRVEILGLIVSKGARRLGIGRRLVAKAEGWAARVRAEAITVRSNVQRTASHAFYPALGYANVKTQAVYRKTLKAD